MTTSNILRPNDWGCNVSHRSSKTCSTAVFLAGSNSNDQNNDDDGKGSDDDSIDLELERKRLESLLGSNSDSSDSSTSSSSLPNSAVTSSSSPEFLLFPISEWSKQIREQKQPMLTSTTRERMEMEITLLESLAESDDAIPEIWNLWYTARGPIVEKELLETETLVSMGIPDAWKQAEEMLKQIIAKEGIHFVEPINRLATLMYLQQRFEESEELCKIVLQLKPWHFGALSGMVMVQQGLQNQQGMLDYAKQRMPPLPKKGEDIKEPPPELGRIETRQEWVDRMLDVARSKLLRLEMDLDEAFVDLDKEKEEEIVQSETLGNTKNEKTNKIESDMNSTDKDEPNDKFEPDDKEDAWQ